MSYEIQKGDPIGKITKMLGVDWDEFRKLNPHAVSRSRSTGKWYIKAGATVTGPGSFRSQMTEARNAVQIKPAPPEEGKADNGAWREYVVKKGDSIWKLSRDNFHLPMETIMSDNGITDARTLQVGQKLKIRNTSEDRPPSPPPPPSSPQTVVASWYGAQYHGRLMSNGKPFDMYANTIAHRDLPLGTRVEIENPATGKVVQATVTDRGPFNKGRDIDLSYGLARQLSLVEKGIGKLLMRVL